MASLPDRRFYTPGIEEFIPFSDELSELYKKQVLKYELEELNRVKTAVVIPPQRPERRPIRFNSLEYQEVKKTYDHNPVKCARPECWRVLSCSQWLRGDDFCSMICRIEELAAKARGKKRSTTK